MLDDNTHTAEKLSLAEDDKYKMYMSHGRKSIINTRITYFYGLVFNSFLNRSADKQQLRDDIQKAMAVLRQEFKLKEGALNKLVLENCIYQSIKMQVRRRIEWIQLVCHMG